MRWIARGLCAGLIALTVGSATAGTPDDMQLIATVAKAVSAADVPTLAEMYQHPPDDAARALAAMGLERIHYNLDASSADARVCERALIDSRPTLAYFCAVFDNGNLRLRAGNAIADAAEASIVERFAGRVPASRLDHLRDYVKAHAGEAAFRVDLPAQDFTLPLEHLSGSDIGALEAQANGKKTLLMVDTGSSVLTLDAATAKRLGVRMLGHEAYDNGVLSHGVALASGVLDRLTIGPVVLHNVPVQVGPGHLRLIGLDVLKMLGTFRIVRNAINVYRTPTQQPVCQQPLLIASEPWGNSIRAVVALPINGTLRTALIDSGNSFYLSGDEDSAKELALSYAQRLRIRDIGPLAQAARVSEATARVVVSGQPIDMTFAVFKDATLPWHYVLGSGALRDMDFYFDFPGRHSCQLLHADLR